jgi:peptide deformylase
VAVPTPTDNLMLLYKLSSRMKVVCKENQGKGLSAVQVGVPWDLFIVADLPKHVRHNDDPWGTFVGCKYEPIGDSLHESIEGCLSLRDPEGRLRFYRLNRHSKVRVRGHRLVDTPTLALEEIDFIFDLKHDSIVFQHEIDHHLGILISGIGKEVLLWK